MMRRDRLAILRDVLLFLAVNGPTRRSMLMKKLKLSLKLFDTYVTGFLKEMGYVSSMERNGIAIYSITRQGLMYLISLLAADPDVWLYSHRTSRDVANELREYGCSVKTPCRILVDEGFEIMCDLLVNCSGETHFPVFIASTDAMFLLKLFLALLASKLTNMTLIVSTPWHVAEKMASKLFAGEKFTTSRKVIIATYYTGTPVGVAASIVRSINSIKRRTLKEVGLASN